MDPQATNGRAASFEAGARSVVSPVSSISSMQQGAGSRGFTPDSTLEENQITRPANGMSTVDRARQPVGSSTPLTPNGQSDSTFSTRRWFGSATRTYGS